MSENATCETCPYVGKLEEGRQLCDCERYPKPIMKRKWQSCGEHPRRQADAQKLIERLQQPAVVPMSAPTQP